MKKMELENKRLRMFLELASIPRFCHTFGTALLSAVVIFASCTQDELPGTGGANGTAALHIATASLQVPGTQPATRASELLTTGSIGVFRSKGTGYTEAQDNKQYTYSAANGWQPSAAADTVYLMANNADVCAYYPYNNAYTDKTAIPLAPGKYAGTADDLTKHDPADICFDKKRVMNGASASTDFVMRHAMAMVQLSFVRLNYAGTACNLTSISIKNKELIGAATLNISDGTYTTVTKAALKWTPGTATPATGIQVPATGVSATTSALLVPCMLDAAGATTFGFTVDGLPMSVKVPAAKLSTFTAGKIHRLKFMIHAASVSLSEVSIIDWTPAWSNADIPDIDGAPKDYIELGGVKWGLTDLYFSNNNTYNFSPSVAVPATMLRWNALTVADGGNKSDTWDTSSDPCTRLEPKGTWTMPTKENFSALVALPNVWTDDYEGAKGQWFGTNDAGEAALHPDRYLFLTAGSADVTGYWTQTYGAKNNPHSLWIMRTGGPVEEDEVAYNTPLGVRCVKVVAEKKEFIELDGVKWAAGNLYQTADGEYHVAEKQGDFYNATVSPVAKWADHTQYFRFGYSSGDPAILPQENDECRKVKDGGWCRPTEAQHIALKDMPRVVGNYVNGGGYSVTGMYFGTADQAEAESHPNNYLFLPYTGRVTSSYDLTNLTLVRVGETGKYLNTQYYGAGVLHPLTLGNWDGSTSLGNCSFHMDDDGSSIRCVKATD